MRSNFNTANMMKHVRYKQTGMVGLFDKGATCSKLSKPGNPLEKLHKVIDFEMFRCLLENHLLNQTKTGKAGCKPYNDFYIRSIGLMRAKGIIGLINLAYSMCRYEQIVRLNLLPIKRLI